MKSISQLGYSKGSPYRSRDFINIHTPEGLIDMTNTDIPLIATDETGYTKLLQPYSGMHQFRGTKVKEVPMQKGGYNLKQIYDYLFDDEEDQQQDPLPPQEPDQDVLETESRLQPDNSTYEMAMGIYNESSSERSKYRGKYLESSQNLPPRGVNPYLQQTQADLMSIFNLSNLGIWGDKAHQARKSDHNTGDAQDFGFDTPETALATVSKLQGEAGQRNIKYIIYNGKIWNPSVSSDWRIYNGPDPHKGHIHVSYNR